MCSSLLIEKRKPCYFMLYFDHARCKLPQDYDCGLFGGASMLREPQHLRTQHLRASGETQKTKFIPTKNPHQMARVLSIIILPNRTKIK